MKTDTLTAYGNRTTACWPVSDDASWVQTRSPDAYKEIKKIDGSKLVAWSVGGGYLMTLEANRKNRWCEKFVAKLNARFS